MPSKAEKPDEEQKPDVYQEILIKPLKDLYKKTKDELKLTPQIQEAFMAHNFRYPEEPRVDFDLYKQSLMDRIERIEQVIDLHLLSLFDG